MDARVPLVLRQVLCPGTTRASISTRVPRVLLSVPGYHACYDRYPGTTRDTIDTRVPLVLRQIPGTTRDTFDTRVHTTRARIIGIALFSQYISA